MNNANVKKNISKKNLKKLRDSKHNFKTIAEIPVKVKINSLSHNIKKAAVKS